MKQKNGIWVPDGDSGILNDMPLVAGVPAYQLNRLEAALDYLPPNRRRRAVDAGAHVGLWTLHMSRFFGHVTCFEPVPENLECWIRNCGHLTNASIYHTGLSDRARDVSLAKVDGSSWSWSIDLPAFGRQRSEVPSTRAKVVRLDSLDLNPVDFLKVDVEGHEYEVLEGAKRTIARCRPVVLIEEKFDGAKCASELLVSLGMHEVWKKKCDHLFVWK